MYQVFYCVLVVNALVFAVVKDDRADDGDCGGGCKENAGENEDCVGSGVLDSEKDNRGEKEKCQ